jgi:Cu2+-exporting ATPase
VVTHAQRLNLLNIRDASRDRAKKHRNQDTILPEDMRNEEKQKEETSMVQMVQTMKIEGMMCPHCEARVKKALDELEGVESAEVSHETGTAVVTGSVDAAILKAAVEAQGYEVLSIE